MRTAYLLTKFVVIYVTQYYKIGVSQKGKVRTMKEFGVLMGMSARPQTKPRWWWGNDGEVIGNVGGFADEGGVCLFYFK